MPPPTPTFEDKLEKNLHAYLDPHATGSIPAWRMPTAPPSAVPFLGGAGAAVAAKIAAGAVVVAMAAGATTEAVVTHSVNPVDWARHATQPTQPAPASPHNGAGQSPAIAKSSPKAGATPSAKPVVSAPSLPTVSPAPLPSLPVPKPTPPSLP